MKLEGIYKFYEDGKLIAESKNSLTRTGRILALKTLMGAIPNFGGSISLGIDGTANTTSGVYATNERLGFRVCSSPVISSNVAVDDGKDLIVFKARIDDPSSYRIHEVGLFSDPLPGGATTNKFENVLNFEESDTLVFPDPTSSGLVTNLVNYRNGDSALSIVAGETVTSNNQISGIEVFDNTDLINLAYYAAGTGSVDVTFYRDASNYSTFRFSHTGAGYRVSTIERGSTPQSSSGTLDDWSNISYVSFTANTATVILDGIRFENSNITDTNNGMISRAVLPTAIQKTTGIPIDIEYYLRIDFNA
jgi:hypothetical protein